MNRIFVLVALGLALILGVGALSAAQQAPAGTGDACASPVGSPEAASPEATPVDPVLEAGIGTVEASPEATPGALVDCASPAVGTPVTAGEAVIEASPV